VTDPENVLKPYLFEVLPERFELNDGEVLVDALVLVRIMDPEDAAERLEYTTSKGLSIYTARGMIEDVAERIRALMAYAADAGMVREEEDGEED
jgi:hypothetical protein